MTHVARHPGFVVVLLMVIQGTTFAVAQDGIGPAQIERLLEHGKLADAERQLTDGLKTKPGDDDARFALGVVQFLRAVEARMQTFYKRGCRSELGMIPFTNLPIPKNPTPSPLDCKTARQLLQGWIGDLAKVEATLGGVKSVDVKLTLHLGGSGDCTALRPVTFMERRGRRHAHRHRRWIPLPVTRAVNARSS